jgi:hypothetical protein
MKIMILAATLSISMPAFAQVTAPVPDIGPPHVAPLEDRIAPLGSKAPASQTPTAALADAPVSASGRPPADATPLVVCSKTITDHCMQRGALLRLMRKNKLLPAANH